MIQSFPPIYKFKNQFQISIYEKKVIFYDLPRLLGKKTIHHIHINPWRPKAIFFCQKSLKITIFAMFIQENKKIIFEESNHTIFYFTCLRSWGKNFMKFDYTKFLLTLSCNFRWLWLPLVEIFFALWSLNWKFFMLNNWIKSLEKKI